MSRLTNTVVVGVMLGLTAAGSYTVLHHDGRPAAPPAVQQTAAPPAPLNEHAVCTALRNLLAPQGPFPAAYTRDEAEQITEQQLNVTTWQVTQAVSDKCPQYTQH